MRAIQAKSHNFGGRKPFGPCSEEDGISYCREAAATPPAIPPGREEGTNLNAQLGMIPWVLAVDPSVTSTLTALQGTSGPWL